MRRGARIPFGSYLITWDCHSGAPSEPVKCECEIGVHEAALAMSSACAKESFEGLKGLGEQAKAFRVRGKTWHGSGWTEVGWGMLVGFTRGLGRKQILGKGEPMVGDMWKAFPFAPI